MASTIPVEAVQSGTVDGLQVYSSRNGSQPEFEGVVHARERETSRPSGCIFGCKRFGRQVWALTRKNLLMMWRNRWSTSIRLGSCILFLLLMFCIIEAINVTIGNQSHLRDLPSPEQEDVPGITGCDRPDCIALAYVPAPSDGFVPSSDALDAAVSGGLTSDEREQLDRVHRVIRSVLANNKGGALNPEQVKGFTTTQAMDDYMLTNQGNVLTGLILTSPTPETTTFVLQLNATESDSEGWFRADEKDMEQVQVSQAIGRELLGAEALDIDLSIQPFAHPPAAKPPPIESGAMAPLFLFAAALFPFVMQISEVVTEREQKLRQSLHVMGMMDSAYWVSWHLFHIATSLLGSLVLCVAGVAFRYELFVRNDFGVLFFTFFFFGLAMTGMAYLISTWLRSSAHALVVGVCFFFLGFILYGVVVAGLPWGRYPAIGADFYINCTGEWVYNSDTREAHHPDNFVDNGTFSVQRAECQELTDTFRSVAEFKVMRNQYVHVPRAFAFIPPTLLTKTLADLGTMADKDGVLGGYGLSMSNVSSYCAVNTTSGELCDEDYSVGSTWGIWFGLYVFYSLLALWFDNVLPDPMGVRKPPWYFVLPSYWGWDEASVQQEATAAVEASEDADVKAEEEELLRRTGQAMAEGSAIEVRGLRKEFARGGRTFHAVKGIQLAMQRQQLFALLGPNGAGKTTLINMLIGVVPPTAGEALVEGHPVAHPAGMAAARELIGVCPQFDILWEPLTAEEHLRLLADIKGLPSGSVAEECQRRLEEVRLREVAHHAAGTFSGGMKRRLSVAMSLIGDPKVLFLDEPTTGMDPVSRRCVWDVIEVAKQDRAVVLTTHSMEEADILADRIGIIAKGRLRCLGSSVHLKSKFGAGYSLSVGTKDEEGRELVKEVFRETLQVEADAEGSSSQHLSFKVPERAEARLPALFEQLEAGPAASAVEGVQVAMSSLEEVFLRIARDADAAAAEDRRVTVTLRSGEAVEVPVGFEEMMVSAQGARFKCVWGLDDVGNMSCLNTVDLCAVSLQATAPESSAPGQVVQVQHGGKPYAVTVPQGVEPGEQFAAEVYVEEAAAVAVSVSEEGGGGAGYGMSEEELRGRVDRLASSYGAQSKAIFYKSLAVQRKRICSNICLCVCPALCIALIFVMQILMELLFQPAVKQRCNYCGPSDDWFGKAYCGGEDCLEFFFPDKGSEDFEYSCGGASKERCWTVVKSVCEEKQRTCGGNGHPSCFWPEAPGGQGRECSLYTRDDDWDARRVANELFLKALGIEEFQDVPDPADDTNQPSDPYNQNPYSYESSYYSWSMGVIVVDSEQVYRQPEGLPIPFAPVAPFLADSPVLYTGSSDGQAERIMGKALESPLGSDSTRARVEASQHDTLWALFSLLSLPKLGCASLSAEGRAEPLAEFGPEAEAAVCALLQHGEVVAGRGEACCLDLTADGDSPTWTFADGSQARGSGQGQARVHAVLSSLWDAGFADQYLSRGNLSASALRCVQPAYTPDLQERLAGAEVMGLEEGLAVVAQSLALPAERVHPDPEPAKDVPACHAAGDCDSPNGRWAQACDRERHEKMGWTQTGPLTEPWCNSNSNMVCWEQYRQLMPDDAGGGSELSCLCGFVEVVRAFAAAQLRMREPDSNSFGFTNSPRLPLSEDMRQYWDDMLPFNLPGLTLTTQFLDPVWSGPWGQDGTWYSMGETGGDRWWTLAVERRYATCVCTQGGLPCQKVTQTGTGDCINSWDGCEWNDLCSCSSEVADGFPGVQQPWNYGGYGYYEEGSERTGSDVVEERPEEFDDGCYYDLVQGLHRPVTTLQVLVADCDELQPAWHMLHLLFNVSRLKIVCTPASPKAVPDHEALDAAVYSGHFKLDHGGAVSSLDGIATAVDFRGTAGGKVELTLMTNETKECSAWEDDGCSGRVRPVRFLTALNQVLEGVLAEHSADEAAASPLMAGIKLFPPGAPWGATYDLGSALGPFFFTFTFLVLFPSIVVTLVQEKVYKIRIMMRMMGLSGLAFWTINYAFWTTIFGGFTAVFLFIVNVARTHTSGYRIGMFANVDGGIQFFFFLGYMLCTTSFAFLWSTMIRSIRVAQVVSVLWIIVLVVLAFVFDSVGDIFNSDGVSAGMKTFLTLFPPLGFYRGLAVFRQYTSQFDSPNLGGSRLTWSSVDASAMPEILAVQYVEAVLFLALALYLDQVLDADFGVPRHPLWCCGLKRRAGVYTKGTDHMDGGASSTEEPEPEDVAAERRKVEGMQGKPQTEQDAVMTLALRKVYEGSPPKEAVKPLTLGVRRGECFGMLGPNGAGKTTTINMLVGFTQPSGGEARVEGLSIVNEMQRIYTIMGVCPQHDLLWAVLTARQHLYFYGRLKNLEGEALQQATVEALTSVNLMDVIDSPAGTYSGGMKRRLSVAISLIGMPLVCYLDEPSTGLDPASRRLLWECVRAAKRSRAVLLTTHSMEEAEGLCDRLGIFVDGRLRCVGAPKQLTQRYGGLFVLTFVTTAQKEEALHQEVLALCPTASPTYALAGTRKYELPASEVQLSAVFAKMTAEKERGSLISWGISSATLEDAFIKIASQK